MVLELDLVLAEFLGFDLDFDLEFSQVQKCSDLASGRQGKLRISSFRTSSQNATTCVFRIAQRTETGTHLPRRHRINYLNAGAPKGYVGAPKGYQYAAAPKG